MLVLTWNLLLKNNSNSTVRLKHKKRINWCFTGGPVVKNPPANTRDTSLTPSLGICHVPRGNGTCAPQLLSPCTLEPCSTVREVAAMRSPYVETSPEPQQLEKAHTQPENPAQSKMNK